MGKHSLTKTNLGLIVTAAVANLGTIVTAVVLLDSGTSYVYIKAQFTTQPILKPAGQFQSRPAGFETGWPDLKLARTGWMVSKLAE